MSTSPQPESKPSKKIAIVQSNYIPWKGYFDFIDSVDEFVLYDDVQFTRRDWRNRNKIKTKDGTRWLTIPVQVKGQFLQKVNETQVSNPNWVDEHLATFRHSYAQAPYFRQMKDWLQDLYLGSRSFTGLSEINFRFITAICQHLHISTKLSWSSGYDLFEGKNERLIHICLQAGATEYVSGPLARDYLDETLFNQYGLKLTYFDYSGYREYPQLFPPFEHGVSVLDLIMNTGEGAYAYVKKGLADSHD